MAPCFMDWIRYNLWRNRLFDVIFIRLEMGKMIHFFKIRFLLGLIIAATLLSSCTFRSKAKTERMAAVVSEVRDKYRADEDISNDNQIFEAYDYFVDTKD